MSVEYIVDLNALGDILGFEELNDTFEVEVLDIESEFGFYIVLNGGSAEIEDTLFYEDVDRVENAAEEVDAAVETPFALMK